MTVADAMKKFEGLIEAAKEEAKIREKLVHNLESPTYRLSRDAYDELDENQQKKLPRILRPAARQGAEGVERLTGTKHVSGKDYKYELEFLGQGGDTRVYGNMISGVIELTRVGTH